MKIERTFLGVLGLKWPTLNAPEKGDRGEGSCSSSCEKNLEQLLEVWPRGRYLLNLLVWVN